MRRKSNELVPLEVAILGAATMLALPEFYGYLIAREISSPRQTAGALIGYGTMYKALERLEKMGYLASRWEDPLIAASENRPRRRLYRVTAAGAAIATSVAGRTHDVRLKVAGEPA